MNPGIYADIPDVDYHADKESLSVSGAKKLLPPSCPARFFYERENGQPHKAEFDFGHAAHAAVLGSGAPIGTVAAPDWRSKVAKERAEALRENGFTPLLVKEADQVYAMAAALREHPIASALLDPQHGKPEQSAYWRDPTFDVTRRARFDWLPDTDGGRLIIPDYKTAQSADPGTFARSAATFGYHMQDAWYRDTAHALGLAEDVAFVFIVQEKTAPYLVTVCELDTEAVMVGRRRNDRALEIYRDCTESGIWPGYAQDVELISLPKWATYQEAA